MSSSFIGFRVTPEMKTLVRAFAERERISESALVKQLLEVLLRKAALEGFFQITELEELAALKRSIAELRVIGNNFNQIAKALNEGRQTAPGRED
jgi:hypothetical protein